MGNRMFEYYKYEEIKQHFLDFIEDQDKEWLEQNIDDMVRIKI